MSNPSEVIIWPSAVNLSDEELSMFSINPLSVMGLCSIVAQRQASEILLSAAASNVNKMAVQYLTKRHINKTIIGMSRSDHYDRELIGLGYDQVLRMDQHDKVK